MTRKPLSEATQLAILTKSRRRCCLCYCLDGNNAERQGQLAHIDRNHENDAEDNLVFLCLDHHAKYDSRPSVTKGLRESELRHYRDILYADIASNPDALKPSEGKPARSVNVSGTASNMYVAEHQAIHVGAPSVQKDPSAAPLVMVRCGLTHDDIRSCYVHFLGISFMNRSDRNIFLRNFFLDLNDNMLFIVPIDKLTGNPQSKQKVEPGDSVDFHILAEDLKRHGRPATDYVRAGVEDAVGAPYVTDESVQQCIASLLKGD